MARKTWHEKLHSDKPHKVARLDKKFADMPEGCLMFIATPLIVDDYIKEIPYGQHKELKAMRAELAQAYGADKTCPVTAGIFLRIASEAAYEEYVSGKKESEITPFWRMLQPGMKIVSKLACGEEFIRVQRKKEGLEFD